MSKSMTMTKADSLFTIAKFLDVHGDILLWDDRKDWGYFSYTNRRKGDPAIGYGTGKHLSPFHHWQLGFLLKVLAQALGYISIMKALNDDDILDEIESTIDEALKQLPAN